MSDRQKFQKVANVLESFRKGAVKVIFPVPEQPQEIKLHWCEQCKKYHRVP